MTDVLIVGAGPVGLTAAAELRRHGVDCRIVERLATPMRVAKAVGIQPRTLEIWEDMGIVDAALDAATPFAGQIVFVNGVQAAHLVLPLPAEVPFGFVGLPQYETERVLGAQLQRLGGVVERGIELRSLSQDDDGVVALLGGPAGEEELRCRYLVGCDGAHSVVRKTLGINFEGGRFDEQYMLADVCVDWSLPHDLVVRSQHQDAQGKVDDLLVCIPLPGRGRYRMSMFVPPELGGSRTEHGFAADRPSPTLAHIQAVLDRLAPQPVQAHDMRWSSVFGISHRLADRYQVGRVFLCGDAAHIHPPIGAQGMNTGIQDAYNLAWKLALAVNGAAAPALLDSYQAERRPVGEEVVGRTVRHARQGFESEHDDARTMVLREAQLLVGYRGSPIVADEGTVAAGPVAGERAPDARGLRTTGRSFALRLFELLRGPQHTLLCCVDTEQDMQHAEALVAAVRQRFDQPLRIQLIASAAWPDLASSWPVAHDEQGAFRAAYATAGGSVLVIRPDGYIGYRAPTPGIAAVLGALALVWG